jgi:hypothetical protein
MKMEQTQFSETSAIKHHTPENNPKDYTRHSEHGEGLKSRNICFSDYVIFLIQGSLLQHDRFAVTDKNSKSFHDLWKSGSKNTQQYYF